VTRRWGALLLVALLPFDAGVMLAQSAVTLSHLSQGRFIGGGDDAGERVIAQWNEISDRAGELVPSYGFLQAEREVASAATALPTPTTRERRSSC